MLSHFRRNKLAFRRAFSVAIALHSNRMQLRATPGVLESSGGFALCPSSLLPCAAGATVPLPLVALGPEPHLRSTQRARKQPPQRFVVHPTLNARVTSWTTSPKRVIPTIGTSTFSASAKKAQVDQTWAFALSAPMELRG